MMRDKADVAGKWSISPWNYCRDLQKELSFVADIVLHDQTLRDGIQFSGVEYTADERVQIAAKLAEMGVKRIEASRIGSDREVLDVVRRIVALKSDARLMGFVEMSCDDIKRSADCGLDGVILCFPSNNHAITGKLGKTVPEIIDIAIEMGVVANELGLETVLFGTDAGRADPLTYADMIKKIIASVRIDSLAFVDTVGGVSPLAVPHIFRFLRGITDKPLEAHFHNDFGLATANTIAALACGAATGHTTVLGIGERSGNAAFQEVAVALTTMYGRDLGLQLDRLWDLCRFVSEASGLSVPANAPIVGDKIFEIVNSNMLTYRDLPEESASKFTFPYHWSLVGHPPVNIALGTCCHLAELDVALGMLKKTDIDDATRKSLLAEIHRIARAEKRSLSLDDVANLASYPSP